MEGLEGLDNPDIGALDEAKEEVEEAIAGEPMGSDKPAKGARQHLGEDVVESFAKRHSLYMLIVAVAAVFIIGIFLRTTMLHFQGFFEPDGFYHYAVMLQAVHNGFAIPLVNKLSGSPTHYPVTEPAGLYYVTLIPYYFLRFAGLSVYDIERGMPVLFGLLDIAATYFIVKRMVNNNYVAVLAMALVAASGGDIARTAALVYRGDGFITIFLLVALLFIFEALRIDDAHDRRKYYYIIAAVAVLGIGTVVWNGAPFTIVVYMLAMLFLVVYGFVKANRALLRDATIMSAALIVTYIIQHIWMSLYFIRGSQAFSSWHFFLFYLPVTIGAALAYYVVEKRNSNAILTLLAGNMKSRIYLFAFAAFVFIAIISAVFYSYLVGIAGGGGLVTAHSTLTKSIQELTPPTYGFLWASFNLELFLAPFTLLFYVLFTGHYSLLPMVGTLIGILLFAAMVLYRKRVFTAKHSDEYFIIILAYFAATMYLQANAVRFNSLVAVPIAILSAMSLYTMGRFVYDRRMVLYNKFKMVNLYYALVFIAVVLIVYYTYLGSSTFAQADGIDQSFLNATVWMRNNTPSNATFLTIWPDGSVIEGWGNRTSLTDSVGGQNGALIAGFADFLFNDSVDTQYLYSVGKPDYILARPYWFTLSGGIAEEGSVNTTGFGLQVMNALPPIYNSTTNTNYYEFISSNIKSLLIMHIAANGTKSIGAYIGAPNGTSYDPINRVLFYNEQSGAFAFSNISDKYVNYTLFVPYISNSSGVSISSGILLGPKLLNSNFFKLVMLCTDASACPYDNRNVTLTPVYVNPDARIYKVTYLNSS
ncbi:Oligosaccharyl transferase STT3 subunit superfamily [mine drainage metagenome]|uniref:Oligosaccharyl transferase STT3 subunit superfamily n=1 Tax=mine drainage metagenome TaxID=410659 RepID=T1AQ65_9ZZZZ